MVAVHPLLVPIRVDETNTLRVGNTRVTLDTVVYEFEKGASPEEIAHNFSAITLTEAYAAITYYLQHKDEIDAYLREREQKAQALRHEIERQFPPDGIRERLLARKQRDRNP